MRALPLAVVIAAAASTHAAPSAKAPARAWLGTFVPSDKLPPCPDCTQPSGAGRAGAIVVLAPADGGPVADGDVVVVSPLVASIARGKVVGGRVALPWFVVDRRDNADGVLVLPGASTSRVAFVALKRPDLAAVVQKLQREDLENVHKATAGLEIAGIDIDGDGAPDFVVTYGCTAWWDGACQSHGQFFLARRGAKWVDVE